MTSSAQLSLACALALVGAGCGNDTPTSASATPAPTVFTSPQSVTFPGVVGPGGSVSRTFAPQIQGTARATVNDITPPTALSVALGVPRADGTGCLASVSSVSGNLTSVEVTAAVGLGTFCVLVYAPAQTADSVRFTMSLSYP